MAFARGKLHLWNFKKWIRFTVYAISVGESLRVSMTISRKDGTIQSVARLKVTVRVKLSFYFAEAYKCEDVKIRLKMLR